MSSHDVVSRPRRRRIVLPIVLLILLAFAWFMPAILIKAGMSDRTVGWVAPGLVGRVRIGSASAGWFSPIHLRDVTVLDLEDRPLLKAARVATDKRLSRLLMNRRSLGTIQLEQPQLFLRLADDTSNLEQLLAALATDEAAGEPIDLSVRAENGTVVAADTDSGHEWRLNDVMLTVDVPESSSQPVSIGVAAQIEEGQTRGQFKGQFEWTGPTGLAISDSGAGHISAEFTQLPLSLLEPILRRAQVAGSAAGVADGELLCRWSAEAGRTSGVVEGSVEAHQVAAIAPEYFGADQIRLSNAKLKLDAAIDEELLKTRVLSLVTDLGTVSLDGTVPLDEPFSRDLAKLLSPRSRHQVNLTAEIDLPRLLGALPSTFRVREATHVDSGTIDVRVSSELRDGQRAVRCQVDADNLSATRDGQTLCWQQPIELSLAGLSSETGFVIERLVCKSSFLEADGKGQLNAGQIKAKADLSQLAQELAKFFDLQGQQLAGSIDARVNWQQADQDNVACQTTIDLKDFSYQRPGNPTWNESHLRMVGNATMVLSRFRPHGVKAGDLLIRAGDDELTATLTKPAQDLLSGPWPATCQLRGNMASWVRRIQPWYQPDGWTVDGLIDAEATGEITPRLISLSETKISMQHLRFDNRSLRIAEPLVKAEGVCTWESDASRLTLPWVTLAATAIALRGENVVATLAAENHLFAGNVAFRGDSDRICHWFRDPTEPPSFHAQGTLQGQIRLATVDGVVRFNGRTTISDFVFLSPADKPAATASLGVPPGAWRVVWSEPSLGLAADGRYQTDGDRLDLEKLKCEGESLRVEATGPIEQVSTRPRVDVSGKLHYDLQGLLTKMRPLVGKNVQLYGQRSHDFSVRGPLGTASVAVRDASTNAASNQLTATRLSKQPLLPPNLTARTAISWDRARLYGFPIGPGQLSAQLAEGAVLFSPLDVSIGSGRLHLAPRLLLNENPMSLVVDAGRLADNIQISPQMCQSWLKYVAPLLANATTATGSFSVNLASAQLPLTKPASSRLAGTLSIHEARVRPGPLANQIGSIADQMSSLIGKGHQAVAGLLRPDRNWVGIANQNVDFQMHDGRVFHRNLLLHFDDVAVRSEGWVGLDQSISLVTKIPVLDKWTDGQPLLAGLRGREISIPIQGTFTQPRVDQNALVQLSQELVGGAAEQFLQGELQKGLQKLLEGR